MLPGVGEGIDAYDFGNAYARGDKLGMGLSAAGLLLPFVAAGSLKRIAEPAMKSEDRIFHTIDDVRDAVRDRPQSFVRYSKSFAADAERGYSLGAGGRREGGLSAAWLHEDMDDLADIDYMARLLGDYSFLTHRDKSAKGWILHGDVVGKGMDNEPLLANTEKVGRMSTKMVANLRRFMRDYNAWIREFDQKGKNLAVYEEWAPSHPQPRAADYGLTR